MKGNQPDKLIDIVPQLTVKETIGNIPDAAVRITINKGSFKIWEKLCCRLRDKFR